jgi:hypothetical protein
MLLVIDNYDSFTYNLVQYLGEMQVEMQVHRNDQISLEQIRALKPERIRRYEGELARFMFNKEVSVTPRGLRLSDRKGRKIPPVNLSSGEHNLICMLTYAFFFDDCALLIDEP